MTKKITRFEVRIKKPAGFHRLVCEEKSARSARKLASQLKNAYAVKVTEQVL